MFNMGKAVSSKCFLALLNGRATIPATSARRGTNLWVKRDVVGGNVHASRHAKLLDGFPWQKLDAASGLET